jgi:hypothetical protein
VNFDVDANEYLGPIDESTLGCMLDALVAGNPAFLEWRQDGVGTDSSSDTIHRAWLLRPEEAIVSTWYESTVGGNIGDYYQRLQATRFDQTELDDCHNENEGVDRLACLEQVLLESSCQGFGPASCE